MVKINLPYHRTHIQLELEDRYLNGLLVSQAGNYQAAQSETELVEAALDDPIGSARLEELISNKRNMVIITSDHTRPMPSHLTLPLLLDRIRRANPRIQVKIIVSTGTHRASTGEEMITKYGATIVREEEIIMHDARRAEDMASVGTLGNGFTAEVNKAILQTEFLLAEGFIEPHFFAGFSGGRKSVFPGVASQESIMANHCSKYIASPYARAGILENNPIHMEATEIARLARLAFILNVALDQNKKIIRAFAGHYNAAHQAGCRFVKELSQVKAAPADIVITTNGGYPLDQNIYQAVKSMTTAEATCKKGGVIIVAAACSDGHGGEDFYKTFKNAASAKEVTQQILSRDRRETIAEQWESQILARILEKHRVILVSEKSVQGIVRDMHMEWAADIDEALTLARQYTDPEAGVTVIPDGISVIVN